MGAQGQRRTNAKVGDTVEINHGGGSTKPMNPGDWGVVTSVNGSFATYKSNDDGQEKLEKLLCCYVLEVSKDDIEARTQSLCDAKDDVEAWQVYNRFRNQLWSEAAIKHFRYCFLCKRLVGPQVNPNNSLHARRKCPVCNAHTREASKAQLDRLRKPPTESPSVFPEYSRLQIIQPSGRRTR